MSGDLIPPSSVQRQAVYDGLAIGMDPLMAMYRAELTDDQIAFLDDDADFQRHVRYYQAELEWNLLQSVDKARSFNDRIGGSTEARWLLSKMNRKRFGNGPLEGADTSDLPIVAIIKKE